MTEEEVKTAEDWQEIENQNPCAILLLNAFDPEKLSPSAAKAYAKAIKSLRSWLTSHSLLSAPLTTRLLADWLITLWLSGHSLSTLSLYLNGISSLYTSFINGLPALAALPSPDFRELRGKLAELSEKEGGKGGSRKKTTDSTATKGRVLSVAFTPDEKSIEPAFDPQLIADLRRMALLAGGLTLEDTIRLRVTDISGLPVAAAEIASRYEAPRRKYIFPLDQSNVSPRRTAQRISRLSPGEKTPGHLWFEAALRIGATPSEAVATLGRIPFLDEERRRIFSLLPTDEYSNGIKYPAAKTLPTADLILRDRVAESLSTNPRRWYALHLRRSTSPQTLRERLEDKRREGIENVPPMPEYYYPHEEITQRIGKRLIHSERALLPEILFVRLRSTEILPLMRLVGDLAWCYKYSEFINETSSTGLTPYAAIPDEEMMAFQLAIGVFTPRTEIYPIGTVEPLPGQQIFIIGGDFKGRTGKFISPTPGQEVSADGKILYRLMLPGDNGIEWQADIDSRLLSLC